MSFSNAGLWGLDDLEDPETAAVVQEAIDEPDRFVLKPQREGGGNNLYGEAARDKLQTKKGLSAYILMQRIRPPINRLLTWACAMPCIHARCCCCCCMPWCKLSIQLLHTLRMLSVDRQAVVLGE